MMKRLVRSALLLACLGASGCIGTVEPVSEEEYGLLAEALGFQAESDIECQTECSPGLDCESCCYDKGVLLGCYKQ